MNAFNYLTQQTVALESAVEEKAGRWFIRLGFAGFNSAANNRSGYASRQAAMSAVTKYSSR